MKGRLFRRIGLSAVLLALGFPTVMAARRCKAVKRHKHAIGFSTPKDSEELLTGRKQNACS